MSGVLRGKRQAYLLTLVAASLLVALSGCQGPTSIVAQSSVGKYRVEVKTDPLTLKPPQLATLSFQVTNNETNKIVTEFDQVLGALFHNIVIRDDLQYFRHSATSTAPQDAASVLTFFPTTGSYHTYTLFQPAGEPLQVYTATISSGAGEDHADIVVDETRTRLSGGLRVQLITGGDEVRAKQPTQLVFRVTQRGEPVTGLWPIYDAPGHLWIVNDHGEDFAHLTAQSASRRLIPEAVTGTPRAAATSGPLDAITTPGPTFAPGVAAAIASATSVAQPTLPIVQQTAQASVMQMQDVRPTFGYGPELVFTQTFPHEGLYKMWLEIEYNDLVLQYDYFVRVAP
ncbi:MAG: hypothetical protein ABIO92_05320 [Chloroflexia bacterium]